MASEVPFLQPLRPKVLGGHPAIWALYAIAEFGYARYPPCDILIIVEKQDSMTANYGTNLPESGTCGRLPRAAFVLSMARSGSTLFRIMLAGSPSLFCPPELNLLQYRHIRQQSLRHAWGLLYALQASHGTIEGSVNYLKLFASRANSRMVYSNLQDVVAPRLLVDKSPEYSASPYTFARMEKMFDGSLYIWLIRHPGGVVDSFVRRPSMNRRLRSESAETAWRYVNLRIHRFLSGVPESRRMAVHFEDLVREPEASMRRVAEFLQIPYSETLTTPFDGSVTRMLGRYSHRRLNGDPWFSSRDSIDARMSDAWRLSVSQDQLGAGTLRLAAEIGVQM